MKRLRFRIEAWLVRSLLFLLRQFPLDFSSWLGGAALRLAGPFLPAHRVAKRNLERAFPEKSPHEIAETLRGMWDNLGRTAGEYPHHRRIAAEAGNRIEIHGLETVHALTSSPRPAIFVSAHLANWEVMPIAAALHGNYLSSVYRRPNNPDLAGVFTDRLTHPEMSLIAKGPSAGRELLRVLRQNRPVAMLIDQKLREGIPVSFFGREAMTPSAFAEFALKLDCDVLPTRIERTGGAHFRLTVLPPMEKPDTGDHAEDVRLLTQAATSHIEDWVRERPSEWFWVHKRWPD
ncbi:lauroyl acyltransferase [Nisaea acidiphila]|uniref:Lauroyl acyltransferase n=1 Tax=Nisaea acidiphila TaxID=1862145 RepID=A0A9J7AWH6_9PROT|nr:lauroyl acyltransferase [Nisaea acidiphila]UUX51470.1 lauroyl acyltransferase [Nisaea acidiphila]